MNVGARIEKLAASVALLTTVKQGNVLVIESPWPVDEAALAGLSTVPGERSIPQTPTLAALAALVRSGAEVRDESPACPPPKGEQRPSHQGPNTAAPTRVRVAAVEPGLEQPPPRELDHVELFFQRMRSKHGGSGFTNDQ